MLYSNGRAYYRVVYPERERPLFVLTSTTAPIAVPVYDCSERGLRYEKEAEELPPLGTEVRGRVRFRDGTQVEVRGVVVRTIASSVALQLEPPGLPLSVIFAEQRYLRAHYPAWFEPRATKPASKPAG